MMMLMATAILTSLQMYCAQPRTSPVARPRITRTAAWLPALPPAPTSIVRKYTMTECCCSSSEYEARMKDETL